MENQAVYDLIPVETSINYDCDGENCYVKFKIKLTEESDGFSEEKIDPKPFVEFETCVHCLPLLSFHVARLSALYMRQCVICGHNFSDHYSNSFISTKCRHDGCDCKFFASDGDGKTKSKISEARVSGIISAALDAFFTSDVGCELEIK